MENLLSLDVPILRHFRVFALNGPGQKVWFLVYNTAYANRIDQDPQLEIRGDFDDN